MANPSTIRIKRSAAALALGLLALAPSLWANEAQAVAINHCIKIVRNAQVNRETMVNTCQECLVAKVERRRPGTATDTPSMRDFTLPGGASQPLPFLGPGSTRILSETPCGEAQAAPDAPARSFKIPGR